MQLALLVCANLFIYARNLGNTIRKPLLFWLERNMENQTSENISKLFNRLKAATKQAEILKNEVNDIRNQIRELSQTDVLKRFTSSFEESDDTYDCIQPCKKPRVDYTIEDGYVVVYTDGACENNGGRNAKAGIGVWFGEDHPWNVSQPVIGRPTNNVAEIEACVKALEIAHENDLKKVKIYTDSQFTINCITKWIRTWKKKNWKLASGGPVKNKDDLIKLDAMCGKLSDIKWVHVSGHSGIRGNEGADLLARQGCEKYRR